MTTSISPVEGKLRANEEAEEKMLTRQHRAWLGRLIAVVAIGSSLAAVMLPTSSFAASEKEYSASFSAECVVGPGALNIKSSVKVTIAAMGPTEVTHGEEGMFHGAHSTITTPVALTEDFALFGANEVKGFATNFVLEGSGGEPSMLNIAKPAEYPEGLPFIAPVEKGKESVFDIPSKVLHETGLTYSFGPEKVTATSGVVKATVSSAKGFTETEPGVYKATGEGLVTSAEGLKSGSRVVSAVTVACTAPPNVVAAEIPVVSGSGLQAGHPEFFDNFVKLNTMPSGAVGWGPVKLSAPALETEAECVGMFFAGAENAATVNVGHAHILGWAQSGDATASGGELSRECTAKKGSTVTEAWLTDEAPLTQSGTLGKRTEPLSVPWNSELRCGEREEEAVPIFKLGAPAPATASTPCETKAAEETEVKKEEEERKGCYASPVPSGCVKLTLIEPSLGLEQPWEGSLRATWANGFGNGFNASKMKFEGEASGRLRTPSSFADPATFTGQLRVSGAGSGELITVK